MILGIQICSEEQKITHPQDTLEKFSLTLKRNNGKLMNKLYNTYFFTAQNIVPRLEPIDLAMLDWRQKV